MITIYGIKNCDTMKKAFKWLDEHHIDYHFHNYKVEGITDDQLQIFLNSLGWKNVLNQRGTTWRKLDEVVRKSVIDEQTAIAVIQQNLSIIKRPIITKGNKVLAGFSSELYQHFFEN